jgi:hypothetical protein
MVVGSDDLPVSSGAGAGYVVLFFYAVRKEEEGWYV